jgi:methionyl-tRNA formyltransferase
MRLVFAGTPPFAASALAALADAGHQIVCVLTQPDRPSGRGMKLTASAVKSLALQRGLPVAQPPTLRDPAAQAHLAALAPEAMVVAAYGLLLPPAVLAIPRFGCLNIHASLLPRWRGAAPIQRALLAGDAETGISIMQMDAGLDTGPVRARRALPIAADETAGRLLDRLSALGAQMILSSRCCPRSTGRASRRRNPRTASPTRTRSTSARPRSTSQRLRWTSTGRCERSIPCQARFARPAGRW